MHYSVLCDTDFVLEKKVKICIQSRQNCNAHLCIGTIVQCQRQRRLNDFIYLLRIRVTGLEITRQLLPKRKRLYNNNNNIMEKLRIKRIGFLEKHAFDQQNPQCDRELNAHDHQRNHKLLAITANSYSRSIRVLTKQCQTSSSTASSS